MNHETATNQNEGARERRWLGGVLLLAVLVRLPPLLTPGYDVAGYKSWARGVWEVGIGLAYARPFPDPGGPYHYSPLFLYLLRAVGLLYAAVRPGGTWDDQLLATLIKVPGSVAEIALGLILWRFVRARRGPRAALATLAAALLNPALIWNTTYWGSIDILHALPTTLALIAAGGGMAGAAGALAALALGSKLTALPGLLALAPALLRRPRRLALAVASGAGALLLLLVPIIAQGQLGALVRTLFSNVGLYPVTTASAHNFWRLVIAFGGSTIDTALIVPGLDYRRAGFLLFALIALPTLALLWRRPDDRTLPFAASGFLSLAFCLVTTEVHENWFYPLFAPLLVAAALDRRYRPLYAALSLTFLLNLALQDPPLFNLFDAGMDLRVRPLRVLNAAAQCALGLWWTWLIIGQARPRRASSAHTAARTPPAG